MMNLQLRKSKNLVVVPSESVISMNSYDKLDLEYSISILLVTYCF